MQLPFGKNLALFTQPLEISIASISKNNKHCINLAAPQTGVKYSPPQLHVIFLYSMKEETLLRIYF